jgi:hypothetical protein
MQMLTSMLFMWIYSHIRILPPYINRIFYPIIRPSANQQSDRPHPRSPLTQHYPGNAVNHSLVLKELENIEIVLI